MQRLEIFHFSAAFNHPLRNPPIAAVCVKSLNGTCQCAACPPPFDLIGFAQTRNMLLILCSNLLILNQSNWIPVSDTSQYAA